MKRTTIKFIAVCAATMLTVSSFAQKFQFGIRYIPTLTSLINKDDKDAGPELDKKSTRSLITAGFAFDYAFNKNNGLEVDILYSRQGQEYTGVNMQSGSTTAYNRVVAEQAILNGAPTVGSYQAKAELNSIKIPILLKISTATKKSLFYTLSVGPQINYLSDAVYELNGNDVDLTGTGLKPIDTYKKVTIDGVLGFGLGYNASKHFVLSLGARFDYGFEDVEKKNVTYSTSIPYYPAGRGSTHNATAGLVFGVSYKL